MKCFRTLESEKWKVQSTRKKYTPGWNKGLIDIGFMTRAVNESAKKCICSLDYITFI